MKEYLTVADIIAEVENIAASKDDDEEAHIMEDELHQTVLRTIAHGACSSEGLYGDASDLAEHALATLDLDFARYCA